jgi:hypothetical protein
VVRRRAQVLAALDERGAERLRRAARDPSPVTGLTHTFYRYPARFSPLFVRAAIELFTQPGDYVVDPFMGGGTALVEALALGRHGMGADISSLAAFVSRVKTTLYSHRELLQLKAWALDLEDSIAVHTASAGSATHFDGQRYQRHLHTKSTWRIRKAIEQSLASVATLKNARLERFARCVVLRTAQWALDSRKTLPSIADFRNALVDNLHEMLVGAAKLGLAAESASPKADAARTICMHRSAVGLDHDHRVRNLDFPKLVITSPPYPGIHVLYHRWQVDGRKETPAPFWIADKLDGSGASYYTMGDRHEHSLRMYFETLSAAFKSIARISDRHTTIIQMVAFTSPDPQLSKYLDVMNDAGFREYQLPGSSDTADGRLWRSVPNRRWHADQKGGTHGSNEVVLIHRKG